MSHLSEISGVQVRDLECLQAAAERLGMELRRDQRSYKWYGRSVGDYPLPEGMTEADLGKCDHALSLTGKPGAYEVGLVKRPDGTVRLLWDWWDGGKGLMNAIGENGGRLLQEYSAAVAEKQARRNGQRVTRTVLADGRLMLSLEA